MSRKPKVLFLCTGNSCRSQMGEGLLRSMAGTRFEVASAGMNPAPTVHPLAVRVMDEIGIDISGQTPKGIEAYLGMEWIQYLLIVCNKAHGTCPRIWPNLPDQNRLYWPFDDPAEAEGTEEERLAEFRRVRDEIRQTLAEWLDTLDG